MMSLNIKVCQGAVIIVVLLIHWIIINSLEKTCHFLHWGPSCNSDLWLFQQSFGGAGVSSDFMLAKALAGVRTLRLADGPDEVHCRAIARAEYRSQNMKAKLWGGHQRPTLAAKDADILLETFDNIDYLVLNIDEHEKGVQKHLFLLLDPESLQYRKTNISYNLRLKFSTKVFGNAR